MLSKELEHAEIVITDTRSLSLVRERTARQNITGTWQGTLKINGSNGSTDLRTVMKITRADNESLKGASIASIKTPRLSPSRALR